MLFIFGKQFLFKGLYTVKIALTVEIGPFFHGRKRGPAFRVDDIGIGKGLGHGSCFVKRAPGFFGLPGGNFLDLGHDLVSLRVGQHHIHAKTGHQANHALGHGERFAVGGRVGPAHGDLFAGQVLDAAEIVDNMEHVRHGLGGMVDIALQVDQGGPLFKHALIKTCLNRLGHLAHVGIALADIHVISNADNIGHERDHVGGFAHGFAMGDLGFTLVQVLHLKAEQVAGAGKTEPGAGRVVPEQGNAKSGIKHPAGDVLLAHAAQDFGNRKGGTDLIH